MGQHFTNDGLIPIWILTIEPPARIFETHVRIKNLGVLALKHDR